MNWRKAGLLLAVLTTGSSCQTAAEEQVVTTIEPSWAYVGRLPTPVSIVGQGLKDRVRVSIDDDRPARVNPVKVRVGDVELDMARVESPTEIVATVPRGLEVGVYDVEVTLGDGQSVTLERGFEVLRNDATSPEPSSNPPTSNGQTGEGTTTNGGTNDATQTGDVTTSGTVCNTGAFSPAEPIWSPAEGPDYGPALAGNGLKLLFSRATVAGGENLLVAERASVGAPFGAPTMLDDGLSELRSTTPFLSADQLRIVFTSDNNGSADLWKGQRFEPNTSFGSVEAIAELNTEFDEARPWLSSDGLTIYFESNRNKATGYDIWQAKRKGIDETFSTPTQLAGVNTALIEGSPSFTADNLHLFYLSETNDSPGKRKLFEARRPGSEQDFEPGTLIESLASYEMNGYASISSDGREVVFSSPGDQVQQLWRAVRQCE